MEFALILPFLMMLVMGVVEFGTLYRGKMLIAGALRSAGRIESQAGDFSNPNLSADLFALTAFVAGAGKARNTTLVKVIVFESATANGAVPAACVSATVSANSANGVAGVCNVYGAAQVSAAVNGTADNKFGCAGSSSWDWRWCVSSRDVTLDGADFVGVWAQHTYTDVTSLLPYSTLTLTDVAVFRMEPAF